MVRLLLSPVYGCLVVSALILWSCDVFRWRHGGIDEQPTLLPTWPGGIIPITAMEEEEEEECYLHVDT